MILHTCPHCKGSSFYPPDLAGQVHCHLCSQAFELSAFTRTERDRLVRALQSVPPIVRTGLRSRITLYGGAGVAAVVTIWLALSWLGLLPDSIRIVNVQTVDLNDPESLAKCVGVIAVGTPKQGGGIVFTASGTACAISNDGFMLTSAHVLRDVPPLRIWVFLNKVRFDAEPVLVDDVGDLAIVKVDQRLPYRFRVARGRIAGLLNQEVCALGFSPLPPDLTLPFITEATLATTKGTISRSFKDAVGTEWIEHTATIKEGASGGPLVAGGAVIGINSAGERGIYRAVSVAPYADKIEKTLRAWRDRKRGR